MYLQTRIVLEIGKQDLMAKTTEGMMVESAEMLTMSFQPVIAYLL